MRVDASEESVSVIVIAGQRKRAAACNVGDVSSRRRRQQRAEKGSRVRTETTTASFSGHMVDLLTSDGQHQGALGRDASACAHQPLQLFMKCDSFCQARMRSWQRRRRRRRLALQPAWRYAAFSLTMKVNGAGRDEVSGGKGDLLTLFALLAAFVAVEAVHLAGVHHLAWRNRQTSREKQVVYGAPKS